MSKNSMVGINRHQISENGIHRYPPLQQSVMYAEAQTPQESSFLMGENLGPDNYMDKIWDQDNKDMSYPIVPLLLNFKIRLIQLNP